MNYYYRKRQAKGLNRSDVAKELGIDFKRYLEIERGERKMPSKLIDKFNKIINKSKGEKQIEHLNNTEEVDRWIDEMRQKENGEFKLRQKMREFNIHDLNELGRLIGYSNGSSISVLMNNTRPVGYDMKNLLYQFFQDELNIQKPKKVKVRDNARVKDKDLIDFYKNFDVDKYMKLHQLTMKELAKKIGLAESTLFYYVTNKVKGKDYLPAQTTIAKVKYYFDNNLTISNSDNITISNSDNITISNSDNITTAIYSPEIREVTVKNIFVSQLMDKKDKLDEQIRELENKKNIIDEMIKLANEIGE